MEGREHTSVKEAHERSSAIYLFCDCNVFFYACVLISKRTLNHKQLNLSKRNYINMFHTVFESNVTIVVFRFTLQISVIF